MTFLPWIGSDVKGVVEFLSLFGLATERFVSRQGLMGRQQVRGFHDGICQYHGSGSTLWRE